MEAPRPIARPREFFPLARPREFLKVSVAGVALAVILTWPLASDLGGLGRTRDVDADGQFAIWNVAWVARTIVADPLRLFDANIFHPHKTTLAYSEANVLAGVVGMPAWWLTGNPWVTMNVAMLFAFASAFVCAYLLIKYLTGDPRAAAIGAVLYAFCPYVFSHLSHIQLLMTGGLPLSMLMLHRLADAVSFRLKAEATETSPAASATSPVASAFRRKNQPMRQGVGLGLALAAQALACAYYGIFAGLMVGYGALVLAATRRLGTSIAYWKAIAVGAVTSIAIVLPFFIPFLRVQAESGFLRTIEETVRYSARAHGYLVSSANAHRWLLDAVRRFGPWEEVLFPGILAVVLGLAGLVVASWRRGRDRETAVLYGTLGVLAFWASFGPAAGLYRVLYHLPTFSFLRAPSRLGLVVVLCLAVFAGIALQRLLAAVSPRRVAAGVAVVAGVVAVAELTIYPLRWYQAPVVPAAYAVLAKQPRGPLAEFPFYGERVAFPLHAQYMLFSTMHWMPMVNGYSDVIPRDFREAAFVLDSFPSNDAFAVLARRRVRYIAIHWDMFGKRQEEIRTRIAKYEQNLRVLAGDERMTLYEVVRYP